MKFLVILLAILIASFTFIADGAQAGMRAYAVIAPTAAIKPATTQSPSKADQGVLKAARRSHGSKTSNKKPRPSRRDEISKPTRTVAHPGASHRAAPATRTAIAREHAQSEALSELIYRSSQFSAPIIKNATACKRIGVHGESIYENCELTSPAHPSGAM